jgi:hypothetical protein
VKEIEMKEKDKAAVPVLRADRVYGEAAPKKRVHARDKLSTIAPFGLKTRQPLTQPPADPKKRRREPRSGMRGNLAIAHIPREMLVPPEAKPRRKR